MSPKPKAGVQPAEEPTSFALWDSKLLVPIGKVPPGMQRYIWPRLRIFQAHPPGILDQGWPAPPLVAQLADPPL